MVAERVAFRAIALTILVLLGCSDIMGPAAPVMEETDRTEESPRVETTISSQEMYDDFGDDRLDTDLWAPFSATEQVEVRETGQRLELTFPASTSGPISQNGVITRCMFVGDFDVQVDYELVDWPAQNGVRIGLVAGSGDVVARHSSGVQDATTGEMYHTNFNRIVGGRTGTTDAAGKLRMTRSGATLTGYYWEGSDWVLLSSGSITSNVAEIPLRLHGWTHDSTFGKEEVRVTFDNMIVNQGTLSCPEPAIKEVAVDIKPGSEDNTINPKSKGGVRVGVLSTSTELGEVSDFDASTIDVATVGFGPGDAAPMGPGAEVTDLDADGDLDVVFRFDLQAAALPAGATEACVSGLAGGKPFHGCDSVRLLEQRGGGKGRP